MGDLNEILRECERRFCHEVPKSQACDSSFCRSGGSANPYMTKTIKNLNESWLLTEDMEEMPAHIFLEQSKILDCPSNTEKSLVPPTKHLAHCPGARTAPITSSGYKYFSNIFPSTTSWTSDLCTSSVLSSSKYDSGNYSQFLHNNYIHKSRDNDYSRPSSLEKEKPGVKQVKKRKRSGKISEAKKKESVGVTPISEEEEKIIEDYIATLRKMVSPFSGRINADTVFTKAVEQIKFLHCELESLTAAYVNSAYGELPQTLHEYRSIKEGKNHETIKDLKSRGLCLVTESGASSIVENTNLVARSLHIGIDNWCLLNSFLFY